MQGGGLYDSGGLLWTASIELFMSYSEHKSNQCTTVHFSLYIHWVVLLNSMHKQFSVYPDTGSQFNL